jgi:hypothetical protein
VSWTPAAERETQSYERCFDGLLDVFDRLDRERRRERSDQAQQRGPAIAIGECLLEPRTVRCPLCGGEHHIEIGPELFVGGDGGQAERIVCWRCGRDRAPDFAAVVLAQRAAHAEGYAYSLLSSAFGWLLDQLDDSGQGERRAELRSRCEDVRRAMLASKANGRSDPASWR